MVSYMWEPTVVETFHLSETERMHFPVDTSVNTCKPELTRRSRLVLNLPSSYCSYLRFLKVKRDEVVET